MKKTIRYTIASAALITVGAGFAGIANAAPPAEPVDDDAAIEVVDDWNPSAEEIAEFNAETDAIVKFLADKGITVETATDDAGFKDLVLDENTPEEVWDAIDQFYIDTYGDEFAKWEPTAEEIAEFNAETDAIVKFLADKGITVETVTDEDGWKDLVLDENTPENVWTALDEYFTETYGDELVEWEPTAEEIAEFNAETDAIVKFLADKGITVETATDDAGFKDLVLDENTPEAVWNALDEYFTETYGDEPILYDGMAVPSAGGDTTP